LSKIPTLEQSYLLPFLGTHAISFGMTFSANPVANKNGKNNLMVFAIFSKGNFETKNLLILALKNVYFINIFGDLGQFYEVIYFRTKLIKSTVSKICFLNFGQKYNFVVVKNRNFGRNRTFWLTNVNCGNFCLKPKL